MSKNRIGIVQKLKSTLQHYRSISKRNISTSMLDKIMDLQNNVLGGSDNIAMTYSAVYNAVLQISQTIASLPLILYIRFGDDSRRRYIEHPLYYVLHDTADKNMNSFQFKETAMHHLLLFGNTYSEIIRDNGNRVRGLRLLNPSKMSIEEVDGELYYLYRQQNGSERVFFDNQVFHVPGLGFDGIQGYSVLSLARGSINLGLKYNQLTTKFIDNSTQLGGVLSHPSRLSKEAHDKLRETLQKRYSGSANSGKIMVLQEGMEFKTLGMPLKDAQFLESKTWQVTEIARWFNMPPHKLKELTNATYDNISSEQIAWIQDTIRPWLVRWENAIRSQLITGANRKKIFAEFVIDALLRADIETRYKAYDMALSNGWMSRNEVRARENLNPIEGDGGKLYTINNKLISLGDVGVNNGEDDNEQTNTE